MSTPVRFHKFGHILAGGAALTLMLAACAPSAAVGTATTGPLATAFPTVAAAPPTQAVTQAPATAPATSAATKIATSAATSAATAAVTANATALATVATNAPLLIESDKLLGMSIKDSSGQSLGTIVDVLVNTTGTVQSVVLNLSTSSTAAGTPAATAAATSIATAAVSTPAATAAATAASTAAASNTVAIPWTSIMADATTQKLTYQGTASGLASMPKFDEAMIASGYVVRAQLNHLPANYDGLIRLGGSLTDINLQTLSGQKLGNVQHVIIDLHTGMANYAVVDVGGFLGVGTQAVMVPWAKLTLDNTNKTTTKPVVRLSITKSSLTGAPKFDEKALTFWPIPADNSWDSKIQLFWQTAAS